MKLVIVESPTKSHTIARYLGGDYKVLASIGHIRDLATSGKGGLGIDVEKDFLPNYTINKDKSKVVKELEKAVKTADEVFIATDPDREGEAIAWHLATVLKLPIETTKRLEFHEITREGVSSALTQPRTIDTSLVSSQETRRILDRIIGFKLSKFLQSKIKSRSAGRVQSATLKLIVDHENEIRNFKPEEYWTLIATLIDGDAGIDVNFIGLNGKKTKITSQSQMEEIRAQIPGALTIAKIEKTEHQKQPPLPFTTSTLQQEAYNKLNMRVKRTSAVASKLFEGITLPEGPVGLITYIRTDATRLSDSYIARARSFINETWGENYFAGRHAPKKVKASENIQDAHEAIRPTGNHRTPDILKNYLSKDEYNLYRLIYSRTLASLMAPKIEEKTTITLKGGPATFTLEGVITIFDGYSKVYGQYETKDSPELPQWREGDTFPIKELTPTQNFTKAPARYSEAKIIRMMEELGIGRPSTYAATIETIQKRGYVNATKGVFTPTEQGELTVSTLEQSFPEFISSEYTAGMEKDLDNIATAQASRSQILTNFYYPFAEQLAHAQTHIEKVQPTATGEKCPQCGQDLVQRKGRFGDFVACSDYPNCKYVKPKIKVAPELAGEDCPECGRPLVIRKNKKNQPFIACSGFPACRYIKKSPKIEQE